MPKALINEQSVEQAFVFCLFHPDELVGGAMPEDAVLVEGIMAKYGLHPQRLESQRANVTRWLGSLPREFLQSGGGGWSFLNACNDANGGQWTDFHQRMEQLFCLGMGLGLVKCLMPCEMWDVLPGCMPYYMVLL